MGKDLLLFKENKLKIDNTMDKIKKFEEFIVESNFTQMKQGISPEERYTLIDTEELSEYMWLKPTVTSLNYDIFVDDGGAYIRGKHPLLIFVRNGEGRSCEDFIPISVSNVPKILDDSVDIVIPPEDIYNIKNFIIINKNLLMQFSKGEMHPDDFVNNLKIPQITVNEGICIINEMATMPPRLTNLPMTIWVDEGGTYQSHAPRIKFKASKDQRTTREYSSITLTKPPQIKNLPQKNDINNEDIEKLKQFIDDNFDNLLELANGKIDYQTQFLPNVVKYSDKQK